MVYQLLRCATCGRGSVVEVLCENNINVREGKLRAFYPHAPVRGQIPKDVPKDLEDELREAEQCAGIGAHRAALALFRSVLEKTVKANGYENVKGMLAQKLEAVHADGLMSDTRKKRADEIKNVGNDILHDEWREAKADEVETMHTYVLRILEDFYDDRPTVLAQLKAKNRTPRS